MLTTILLTCFGSILLYVFYTWRCLVRNEQLAKGSGFHYVIIPIYTFNRIWLLTHKLFLPLLERLPKAWTHPWIDFLEPEWSWRDLYEPFERYKTDAFIVVSPGKNTLYVADANAINQITTRRNDFPKPTEIYEGVNIFGPNVVGTEGSVWRHHRKITSPPFTEKSNALVFRESIRQAQAMLSSWVGSDGTASRTVHGIAGDTMRLSLYVISKAGFGVHLLWPHEEGAESVKMPPGHTMTYKDALTILLENILFVIIMPRWLLKNAPFKKTKLVYESLIEWGQYMRDIYESKRAEVRQGKEMVGLDLMGALVRGAGTKSETTSDAEGKPAEERIGSGNALSMDEILGNAFVFILAGHETAANTLHYSLLFLAMKMQSQRRLQADLDKDGFKSDPSGWDYERDIAKLFGGMAGAVMNEELRLIPPVINIPKSAITAQPLIIDGKRTVVPAGSAVNLTTVATQRNPHTWKELYPGELNEFRPERWLLEDSIAPRAVGDGVSVSDAVGDHDVAATLLRPPKGAYIPFSDGARACLGRRFAQVEVLAVLAVIFREYSVELAVDEFASDEEVEKMPRGGAERKLVWTKARDRAQHLLRYGMSTIITLQMRTGHVPLRFVKRGSERFVFDD